jgi:cardiolipin synthase A/B
VNWINDINWESIFSIAVLTFEIITILTVIFVVFLIILENKNPVKTHAWLLMIFFLPIIGIILYFYLGRNIRKEKIFSRKERVDIERFGKQELSKQKFVLTPAHEELLGSRTGIINLVSNTSKSSITDTNSIKIFDSGVDTFEEMLQAIDSAKEYVHLEFYIIDDDTIGNRIKNALINKRKQNIEIRIIYDEIGSWSLSDTYLDSLTENGIEHFSFMPVRFYKLASKINYRNHRKILIIDGKVAFIGGMNIADNYLTGMFDGRAWKDVHIRLEGDAVKSLQMVFLSDWYFVSKQNIFGPKYFPENESLGKKLVQIASSGPDSDWASIKQSFLYAISTARSFIKIVTPYFHPDETLLEVLKTVSLSGVSVTIVLPEISDSKISHLGSMSYINELVEAKISVLLYKNGFIHSKLLLVDNLICSIGSANFDFRSFEQNFEVNAFIFDKEVSENLNCIIQKYEDNSISVTRRGLGKKSIFTKFTESLARLLSPIM